MEYNEDLKQYCYQYNGILFAWDEEPKEGFEERVKKIAENYYKNFDRIVDFMLPDLREMYGDVKREDVKEKLGMPIINYEFGSVTYCEQTFDYCHIFDFELSDDEFQNLDDFSVNG